MEHIEGGKMGGLESGRCSFLYITFEFVETKSIVSLNVSIA